MLSIERSVCTDSYQIRFIVCSPPISTTATWWLINYPYSFFLVPPSWDIPTPPPPPPPIRGNLMSQTLSGPLASQPMKRSLARNRLRGYAAKLAQNGVVHKSKLYWSNWRDSFICLRLSRTTKMSFGYIHTECIKHQHTKIQKAYSYQTGEIDYYTTLPKCR
jgi:hypothetical protein